SVALGRLAELLRGPRELCVGHAGLTPRRCPGITGRRHPRAGAGDGGVVAGFLAVSALVHGSSVLVRETRLVVQVLQERAASVHARAVPPGDPTASQGTAPTTGADAARQH